MLGGKPVSFSNHEGVQAFLREYQEYFKKNKQNYSFAKTWQEALYADLVVDLKDRKTYRISEGSNAIKGFTIEGKLDEKKFLQAFLLAKGKKAKTKHLIPNFALTQALIQYDHCYSSVASNRVSPLLSRQFLSYFEGNIDSDLPIFTPLGQTIGLTALKKNQPNELFRLLKDFWSTFLRGGLNIDLIDSLMTPHLVYYTGKNEQIDGTKTSLNDALLSLFLVVNDVHPKLQGKAYNQLKKYNADYTSWKQIHLSEIAIAIAGFLAAHHLFSLFEPIYMPPIYYIIASFLAIIAYPDMHLNIVRLATATSQALPLLIFLGAKMLVDSPFFSKTHPKDMHEFFLANLGRAIFLLGAYNVVQLVLENIQRIRHATNESQIASARLSCIKDNESMQEERRSLCLL